MRKVLLLLVGIAVLWVPAVSVAGDSSPHPSTLAAEAETPDAKGNVSNPASACKSERSHAAAANTFGKCVSTIAKHKTERDGKDSTESDREDGVESHRKHSSESHDKTSTGGHDKNSTTNPALTCKAMQANDLAHFQTTYGTRPNAFGKCVAGHANSEKG